MVEWVNQGITYLLIPWNLTKQWKEKSTIAPHNDMEESHTVVWEVCQVWVPTPLRSHSTVCWMDPLLVQTQTFRSNSPPF